MNPDQLSDRLRRIASYIESSKAPSAVAVAAQIRSALAPISGKRVANGTVKVHVTMNPNRVTVEYAGQTHSATWPDDADLGDFEDVVGDPAILAAAMNAWIGEESFELTPEELSANSRGHWANR